MRLVVSYLAFSRFASRVNRVGNYDPLQLEWVEAAVLMHRGASPIVPGAHDVIPQAERAFLPSHGVRRLFRFAKLLLVRPAEKRIMPRFDRIFILPPLPRTTIPIPAGLGLKPASPPG